LELTFSSVSVPNEGGGLDGGDEEDILVVEKALILLSYIAFAFPITQPHL